MFYLVYGAHFDLEAINNLPVFERRYFLKKFIEAKQEEEKQLEEAKQEMPKIPSMPSIPDI